MNGVLSENQVVRVCIEENFHMGAIHKYLKQFEMDAKYKGLDQFEWNTASTRTEKKQQAKDQIEARKNFKQEQEKRRLEFEERQARRERWQAEKEKRRAAAEQRRKEREEADALKAQDDERKEAIVEDVIGDEQDADEGEAAGDYQQ